MPLKNEKGQAMVEFALILPLLLLLLCAIIDFGWIFGNQLIASNAAREAARYTAIHYYDSSTDNDVQIASVIVAGKAPTLVSPTVTLTTPFYGAITVKVTCQVDILTPIVAVLFTNGEYSVVAECTMRLE